jgi:hypothetical protein
MTEGCQARPLLWNRRRFHVLVAILILLTALLLGALDWTKENTTESKFSRIDPEMTVQEVQDILGPPSYAGIGGIRGVKVMTWNPSGRIVQVYFDSDGRMIDKEWGDGHTKRSLKDLTRDLLGKLGL